MEKLRKRKGVLRPLLKRYAGAYLLGLVTLLVVDYVDLFVPKLIGEATDGLTAHTLDARGILLIAGRIVLCGAVVMFGRFWWRHFIFGSARKIERTLRDQMFEKLETLSQRYYNAHKTGDLMSYFTNDLEAVRMAIGPAVVEIFDASVLTVLVLYRMMTYVSVQLTLYILIPMGAIAIFLCVLGLGRYKGREKWWLLAATIVAILMAVGSHFMAFTAFCFKYLPLYNKFRTVSMALVVLQVSLPVLGFLTLDRIVREEYSKKELFKASWIALAVTGGFCFLCWLAPGMCGSFSGDRERADFYQVTESMQDILVDALVKDRIALFKADAIRSLLLILASFALLFWAFSPKGQTEHAKAFAGYGRKWVAAVCICLFAALDLFAAGKRYLNADDFVTPKDFNKPFAERPVDKMILEDQDPQYRVLDITVNVFNSSVPSYRHKNVGGYSPAKLQRYQDLIDHYLTGEINGIYKALRDAETLDDVASYMADNTPVLNALNTRYLIVDDKYPPVENYAALGPAWFVDSVVPAATPDEEIALIGQVDLRTQAVVDARSVPGVTSTVPGGTIEMTSYTPNEVRYRYSTPQDRVAVFSEVFYPNGWTATVDGQPINIFRADWTLRGALLPAGDHEVVMRFAPQSYKTGATVSLIASLLLLLMLAAAIGLGIFRKKGE